MNNFLNDFFVSGDQIFNTITRRLLAIFPTVPLTHWLPAFEEKDIDKGRALFMEASISVVSVSTAKQIVEFHTLANDINEWMEKAIADESSKLANIVTENTRLSAEIVAGHKAGVEVATNIRGLVGKNKQAKDFLHELYDQQLMVMSSGRATFDK